MSVPSKSGTASADDHGQVTGNRGCGIQETTSPNSLGANFAQNGGGVYAMYWSVNGFQMWFFGVRAQRSCARAC
jgi:hypothetical protein